MLHSIAAAAMRPLSVSQINTWMKCQAQWYYTRELGLFDPGSLETALGRGVDHAIMMFLEGRKLGRTLTPEQIGETLSRSLTTECLSLDLQAPPQLYLDALALVNLWIENCGDVQALHTQHPVSGTIGGIAVAGVADIVEHSGVIRDVKTTGRTPSELTGQQRTQAAVYATLLNSDRVVFDVLVNLKKEKRYVPLVLEGEELIYEQHLLANTLPTLHEQIQQGLIVPNRHTSTCSRRYCAFVELCEKEYGGRVRD
jgi:hypothetical protein